MVARGTICLNLNSSRLVVEVVWYILVERNVGVFAATFTSVGYIWVPYGVLHMEKLGKFLLFYMRLEVPFILTFICFL